MTFPVDCPAAMCRRTTSLTAPSLARHSRTCQAALLAARCPARCAGVPGCGPLLHSGLHRQPAVTLHLHRVDLLCSTDTSSAVQGPVGGAQKCTESHVLLCRWARLPAMVAAWLTRLAVLPRISRARTLSVSRVARPRSLAVHLPVHASLAFGAGQACTTSALAQA